MGCSWRLVAASALVGSACFHPTYDRPACGPGGACPAGLTCLQPQQICDREGAAPIDARDASEIDSPPPPPDARACFGTGIVQVCLAKAPSQPLSIDNAAGTIINTGDTSASSSCVATVAGAEKYCVVAATTINITNALHAIGPKPLILLATDSITTAGVIDVGSHRLPLDSTGAGADDSTCAPGIPATGQGGGAGGSFTGRGGNGGNGNGAGAGASGAAATLPINTLRGGCAGQNGGGNAGDRGAAGHGGGVVFLIAVNSIDIGGGINAAGEGGTGGTNNSAGAGGGGSGGMIGFDAPSINIHSLLTANGGGGGEGCSATGTDGVDGADGAGTTAAAAGAGNSGSGGDGGNGSAGPAAGQGQTPLAGGTAGGGGGGGGAGLINIPVGATIGNQISPLSTP